MNNFSFDSFGGQQKSAAELAAADTGGDFELMPPHKNQMILEALEIKQNEVTGTINLFTTVQIVGNQYANRKIWKIFNLVKGDGSLNEISQFQIGALALAVGYPEEQVLKSPEELLAYIGKPFEADVKIEKGTNGYQDKNTYANPKKIGVAATAPTQQAHQPAQGGFGQAPAQSGGFGGQAGGFGGAKPFGQ